MRYRLSSFDRRLPLQADIAGKQQVLLVTLSSAQPISQQADSHSSSDIPQYSQPLLALLLNDQIPPYSAAIASPVSCVKPACPGWVKPHQWSPSPASSNVQEEEGGVGGVEGGDIELDGAAMRYRLSSFDWRLPWQADIAGKQQLLLVTLSSAQPISQQADSHSSSDIPQYSQPLF